MCLFVLLLRYWSSFAVAFLAFKIKLYIHVSHKQLFDYLSILKYMENENLNSKYFSQHNKRPVNNLSL